MYFPKISIPSSHRRDWKFQESEAAAFQEPKNLKETMKPFVNFK